MWVLYLFGFPEPFDPYQNRKLLYLYNANVNVSTLKRFVRACLKVWDLNRTSIERVVTGIETSRHDEDVYFTDTTRVKIISKDLP